MDQKKRTVNKRTLILNVELKPIASVASLFIIFAQSELLLHTRLYTTIYSIAIAYLEPQEKQKVKPGVRGCGAPVDLKKNLLDSSSGPKRIDSQ
jgi:hypothetical protein